jgi:hypothetical protein
LRLFGSLIVLSLLALDGLAQLPDAIRDFDLVVYGGTASGCGRRGA